MAMLEVKDINVYYGAIHAIKGISLTVDEGEIVTLIGANGAGKSTTLRTISGLLKPKTGAINFLGKNISGMPAHKIVREGISQVPEGRRIFAEMSVLENLELGAFTRNDKDEIKKDLEMVFGRFPRLKERITQQAGTLSGGEQQMLAMGRALMSRPKLLLLDEPSMGLAPLLIREIFSIIADINKTGTTVLLVEQNANMALSIANRAYVLETGRITLSGDARELAASEDVRKAYLKRIGWNVTLLFAKHIWEVDSMYESKILNVALKRAKIHFVPDVVYAQVPTFEKPIQLLQMDLLIPQIERKLPAVIFVTGGGFISANKARMPQLRMYLAEKTD